jgi:hypothetical protein
VSWPKDWREVLDPGTILKDDVPGFGPTIKRKNEKVKKKIKVIPVQVKMVPVRDKLIPVRAMILL